MNIDRFIHAHAPSFIHENAYGYIKYRSTRANASRHKGAKIIVSADIKEFFPSISIGHVEHALRKTGMKKETASLLAKFLTINNSLPLGLNASPTIANLVANPIDIEFTNLAKRINCTYTRYADDLTFSGDNTLPSHDEINGILGKFGFRSNERKFRASKRGQKHYVTGLSVADPKQPHVPRGLKRKLRQELYYIQKYGLKNHVEKSDSESTQRIINRLDGTISYVTSVESQLTRKLRSAWTSICQTEKVGRSFEPRPLHILRDAYWFIDESEIPRPDGSTCLALCCVELSANTIQADEASLTSLIEKETSDAYQTAKSSLHWAESTLSQRERIVDTLMPRLFSTFVVLENLSDEPYKDTYIRALKLVIDPILRRSDDAIVEIMIEANPSKISQQSVTSSIKDSYLRLVELNERRPVEMPKIRVEKKGARPALLLPDIMLGALSTYAKFQPGSNSTLEYSFFEKLRTKYTIIIDTAEKKLYHRKNPFTPWHTRNNTKIQPSKAE
ncbi:reverse transcriptase family protein [Lysobacter sp. yr284]|uniref:reverse transcriptase family protein n=1 Tax=Lysobacter sp. yr284 TaxID=1761791 RepID=UPI001587E277|nr:reverse transcriptase family protein [Lysobacter sp. yr284]